MTRRGNFPILAILLLLSIEVSLYGQNSLALSSGNVGPGGTIVLGLNLTVTNGALQPAALQWTLSYSPTDITSITVVAGTALTSADKMVACNSGTGWLTCLAFGMNTNTISSGVVAQVNIAVAPAPRPSVTVSVVNGIEAFGDGTGGPITSTAGIIVVQNLSVQPNPVLPVPVSSDPVVGTGNSPFAFTFSDPRGWQNLGVVNILIDAAPDGRHACFLAYSRPLNVLYLVADDGGTLLAGAVLTSSGSTSNSQCMVSWGNSPVNGSGNTLVLSLNIAFSPVFTGNKVIYMAAGDVAGNNSGWHAQGVWKAPGAALSTTTAVVGMNPDHGSETGYTAFTFHFSDTLGFGDLGVENILINNFLDGRNACYLAFARPIDVLYLVNDAGDALLPGQSLSAGGTLSNSQCTVSWWSGAVVAADNGLALSLNISFSPAFGGGLVFYAATRDRNEANNTGWQPIGMWRIE